MTKTRRPEWLFDDSPLPDPHGYGQRAVDFLRWMNHPKTQSGKFELDRWKERLIRKIYGTTREDGTRQYRTVWLQAGRGSHKTSLGAGAELLHLAGPERVPSGNIYSAANSQKQSALIHREMAGIIRSTPWLKKRITIQNTLKRCHFRDDDVIYEAMSADASNAHGLSPLLTVVDEYHEFRTTDLMDAIRSGQNKLRNTLLLIATTAGAGRDTPAYDFYAYAKDVAADPSIDPTFLPVIFEAAPEDDWQDEAIWHEVNPGLEFGYPDLESMRNYAREAAHRPSQRDAFRRLHLGVWLEQNESPWLDMAVYDEGARDFDSAALREAPCFLGVDLGFTEDLSAIVAAFPRQDGRLIVVPYIYAAEDTLAQRQEQDGQPWLEWRDDGHLLTTPGRSIDLDVIEAKIRELCEAHDVREIAIDRFGAFGIRKRLEEDGLPIFEHGQSFGHMGPAIKAVERLVLEGRLIHGGHPVLRNHFANAHLRADDMGNQRFQKGRDRARKVDGAIAAVMAAGRADAAVEAGSIFDDYEPGSLVLH
ncbi:MAG: terminase large subunit [Aquamicrobium sp.]|uniref:terminase large subunit n=1 Tax=Aquamicrobium sp. TaxID=1872579 RepID=UPI00349E6602|nr:terminase large subunit [Aquamicrobium sp.]